MHHRLRFLTLIILMQMAAVGWAQHMRLKTNLLYWATATPNAAAEFRVSDKWSLDCSVGWNPFTFSHNHKWKHIAVQPEARYWLCHVFQGHFIGAHALYSHFNAGGVDLPFGLLPDLKEHRNQGDLAAVGLVYGYDWMLPGNRWNIEAEVGLGYAVAKYKQYRCPDHCASLLQTTTKHMLMPTKLALNITYTLK